MAHCADQDDNFFVLFQWDLACKNSKIMLESRFEPYCMLTQENMNFLFPIMEDVLYLISFGIGKEENQLGFFVYARIIAFLNFFRTYNRTSC